MGFLFFDWRAWLIVLALSVLTLLSAVTKYQIGEKGLPALEDKFPQDPPERWEKAGLYFERWGAPIVFLSFLPVMGTIMPSAAGAFGVAFRPFLVWAFLAKMFRYALLLLIISGGISLFSQAEYQMISSLRLAVVDAENQLACELDLIVLTAAGDITHLMQWRRKRILKLFSVMILCGLGCIIGTLLRTSKVIFSFLEL